ncbi:hypothetical protein PInf_010060 [Phytophthora infestans]|nr:hypothetical protein PInf_010060 [Phytophthora infestans]
MVQQEIFVNLVPTPVLDKRFDTEPSFCSAYYHSSVRHTNSERHAVIGDLKVFTLAGQVV